MVRLIAVAQTAEDVDGVRDRRLRHLDRLEAALQRGVLLDVLAIFVQRRRTDRLQLPPGQHGLEDRRRVDRALGSTGSDERMDLVDEQHDVAAGLDLLQHLLEALLEVTAITRSGDQCPEVERIDLLVPQRLGHVSAHDLLGQALDDGRLAHARLTDEDRVVLGPPGEHGHDPLDLRLPADDGVELVLPGRLRQIPAELVEHRRTRRALAATLGGGADAGGLALAATLEPGQQLQDLVAHSVEVGTQLHEHLGGNALALTDESQQDVLGPDIGMVELQRLAQRQLQDLLGTRGERDVAGRRLLAVADDLLDLLPHRFERDPQRLHGLRRDTLTLVDQAQQDVFGADVIVVEHPGFVLGEHDDPPGPVSEPLEHVFLLTRRHPHGACSQHARRRRTPVSPNSSRTLQQGWANNP